MPTDPFLDESGRLVTLEAFDFILRNELKRAQRAQNFLTLLVVTTPPDIWERAIIVRQLAGLVSLDVRETDLVAQGERGRVWVLLLDTDLENAMAVIDRLLARLRPYAFPAPVSIEIGAASCPMHGSDADSLRRAALAACGAVP
jgi:hypothetical protein